MVIHRGIAGEVEGESCLTDRRAGGEDDEVRTLPAVGDTVDADKSGRDSAETFGRLLLLDIVHRLVDDAADILDLLADVALDGVIDLGLSLVDEVVHGDGIVVCVLEDIVRSGDEIALYGLLLEYLDVILHVGGAADLLCQSGQYDRTSDGLQVPPLET